MKDDVSLDAECDLEVLFDSTSDRKNNDFAGSVFGKIFFRKWKGHEWSSSDL